MKNYLRITLVVFAFSTSLMAKMDIKKMFTSMGTAMGSMFGAAPKGFTYSFQVWSDANVPIYVEIEPMSSIMGAFFQSASGFYGKQTLPSIFNANGALFQADYNNEPYYFNFYIAENSIPHRKPIYKQELHQLPLAKGDPNVYYYHVYTKAIFHKGKIKHTSAVEALGYQNPNELNNADPNKKGNVLLSSQLSTIVFENNSSTDIQITLTYGPAPYTFAAEKYSFNSLSIPSPQEPSSKSNKEASNLPPPFSLRPNSITFASASGQDGTFVPFKTLKLPAQGFDGNTHRIEIYQDEGQELNVCVQGFNPGNYTMSVSSRTRDVTPCPCFFWYQSAEQAGSVEGYADLPGQIWVVYQGQDSPIFAKVTPGNVVSWNLTRPLIRQSDQFVYFIYVATTNDAQAQQFVTKVVENKLGQYIVNEYTKAANSQFVMPTAAQAAVGLDVTGAAGSAKKEALTLTQQVSTLLGSLSITNGAIVDKDSGVIGYVVGADVFMPCGLGFGRFYYQIAPSILSFDTLVSAVSGMVDNTKASGLGADLTVALTNQIKIWYAAYLQDSTKVQDLVQKFLIQYGNAQLVKGTALTAAGKAALKSILSGNVSLKYPSMKLSTVSNQYVFDFGKAAPEKMPGTVVSLPRSTSSSPVGLSATAALVAPVVKEKAKEKSVEKIVPKPKIAPKKVDLSIAG